jgi:hypothetical protein
MDTIAEPKCGACPVLRAPLIGDATGHVLMPSELKVESATMRMGRETPDLVHLRETFGAHRDIWTGRIQMKGPLKLKGCLLAFTCGAQGSSVTLREVGALGASSTARSSVRSASLILPCRRLALPKSIQSSGSLGKTSTIARNSFSARAKSPGHARTRASHLRMS